MTPGREKPKRSGHMLRRLTNFARRPPIEGFVDRVVAGEVHGWAFDPARPERRLLVVATLEGSVLAETLADLPRKDLEAAGKGDGRHGFRLRLPASFAAPAAGKLQVQVMVGSQRHPLQRGAVELPPTADRPPLFDDLAEQRAVVVGFVESCRGGAVKGWAVNPNNPEAPAVVDLFDGELYLGSATATAERPRLQRAGAPVGARGFVFKAASGRALGEGPALRARIAGTRLELRRSKSYPGVLDGAPRDGEDELADRIEASSIVARQPADGEAQSPSTEPAGPLFLVLDGDEQPTNLPETDRFVRLGASMSAGLGTIGDGAAFRARVAASELVVLLSPGHTPALEAERVLAAAPLAADVLVWPTEGGGAGDTADPKLKARLGGGADEPLAIRPGALLTYPGDLLADLLEEGVAPIRRWAAQAPGLRWIQLPGPLTTAPVRAVPSAETLTAPAIALSRVSIGAWSGWEAGPPPAVTALLAQATGLQVEVLSPASDSARLWEAALTADVGRTSAEVTVRQLDGWLAADDSTRRTAIAAAASGEILVLCHGSATPAEDALSELAAWAKAPGVGLVTTVVTAGDEVLAGLELSDGGEAIARPGSLVAAEIVDAASPVLLAVSRKALLQVDGFDPHGEREAGHLDLALRLRRRGLSTVLLGRQRTAVEPGALSPWMRQSLPLTLRTRHAATLPASPAGRASAAE